MATRINPHATRSAESAFAFHRRVATTIAIIIASTPQVNPGACPRLSKIRLYGHGRHWHTARNGNMNMTTKNATPPDALRAALKAAGFNARRVTVRQHHSTLCVTIRDASAPLTKIKTIAGSFESIRRCHVTGEILCGGYVTSHITTVMW